MSFSCRVVGRDSGAACGTALAFRRACPVLFLVCYKVVESNATHVANKIFKPRTSRTSGFE